MNRAARIASIARPGQVLASADVWHAVQPQALQKKLCGMSMGAFSLKGVAKPIEVFSIMWVARARVRACSRARTGARAGAHLGE